MTWTYSATDLSTDLARVRLLIGDTNTHDQLLSDEEVAYLQTLDSDLRLVAARCCDAIVGKLSRDIDRSNLGMSAQRSQKVQHYMDLAKRLREEAKATSGEMEVGGISYSDEDSLYSDADFKQPVFRQGMHDNV